jgi:hypothetical protein
MRLWFVSQTEKARHYCRIPKTRNPGPDGVGNINYIWIPRSVVSHTQKRPSLDGVEWPEHDIEIEDWFSEKSNL